MGNDKSYQKKFFFLFSKKHSLTGLLTHSKRKKEKK